MRPSPALRLVPAQVKNQVQDISEDGIPAPRITPVLTAAVVAVFITATEAFAKVVLIISDVDIVSVVTITGIQIRIAILRIKAPSVLLVGLTGVEAFFVSRIDCLSEQVRAVLIHVVVLAIAIVAIVRCAIVVIVEALKS